MPMHSEPNAESGDNPRTPASEPARTQATSPQKKRRKVSRSQSIPAQPSNQGGFYPPPNVYAPLSDPMGGHHPYDDHMHGPPMSNHMQMGHPNMGAPHPAHHMGPLPPHMQHPHHPGNGHPGHHVHPGHMGHPMNQPHGARYMRQASAPMAPPHGHMSPHAGPPHMHPQGMSPQMGGHMPPGGGPGGPPPGMQAYSPGMVSSMASRVYPRDQPMIFNQANPHAPPIYPCGSCHKEVSDSDQAILCESGCNFWFHRQCTGLTEQAFQLLTKEVYAEWVCDPCLNKKNIPLIKLKP